MKNLAANGEVKKSNKADSLKEERPIWKKFGCVPLSLKFYD